MAPVGCFSEGARLQRWHFTSRSQSSDSYRNELHGFNFVSFVPSSRALWLKRTFSTTPREGVKNNKKLLQNISFYYLLFEEIYLYCRVSLHFCQNEF
jgi:hypothetical protein